MDPEIVIAFVIMGLGFSPIFAEFVLNTLESRHEKRAKLLRIKRQEWQQAELARLRKR